MKTPPSKKKEKEKEKDKTVVAKNRYRIQTEPNTVRIFDDPMNRRLKIIHAYVPVRNFPNGMVPDDVNPRSHERLQTRIAADIEESIKESPEWFHLANRGVLVLADDAGYDEQTHTLYFSCRDKEQSGLADGATTDRVLARVKRNAVLALMKKPVEGELQEHGGTFKTEPEKPPAATQEVIITNEDFAKIPEGDIPPELMKANLHLEIIVGDISENLVKLAGARNTSTQVKEFALENLGGGFEWMKDVFANTEFAGRIRYRENDPEPVDIRTVLALLTLFHPKWSEEKREPVTAYTNKAAVLEQYRDESWQPGYQQLKNVAADILRFYDYIHVNFQIQYDLWKKPQTARARLAGRKEVRCKEKGLYTLPLTLQKVQCQIPDGWLYPIAAAFRMLLFYPLDGRPATWQANPQDMFDDLGHNLIADVVEASDSMGRNAAAVGKSRQVWNAVRKSVEMKRLGMVDTQNESQPEEVTAGKR